MANVIIQIYGIRTVEDARMVIDMGGHHIGVSYGKIKRTPGQLTCEKAKEIFEGVQPEAVKVGLTVAEDIDEITENLKVVCPDVLHLSGDIEGITPAQVQELAPAAGAPEPAQVPAQALELVQAPAAGPAARTPAPCIDPFLLNNQSAHAPRVGRFFCVTAE